MIHLINVHRLFLNFGRLAITVTLLRLQRGHRVGGLSLRRRKRVTFHGHRDGEGATVPAVLIGPVLFSGGRRWP